MTNQPTAYIDGFLFPLAKAHLNEYRQVAEQVAAIWKEHGALAYCEYVGDDLKLEGTRSFLDAVEVGDEEPEVIGECLAAHGVTMPLLQLGLPDRYVEHGDPALLLAQCGLDAAGIERSIRERFGSRPVAVRPAANE